MIYTVFGDVTCVVSIQVKANNEEEALQKAEEKFGGVGAYCGNGGTDKLIGVCSDNETIYCDDEPVFSTAVLYGEDDEDFEDEDDEDV